MKNFRLPLTIIAFITMGIIVINSCKKTETGATIPAILKTSEYIPGQAEVIPLIKNFNQRCINHQKGFKSTGNIPLPEALWILEAGVNYEYRSSKDSVSNITYDTLYTSTGIYTDENGSYIVTENDLIAAYSELLTNTNILMEQGDEEKQLLMADVSIAEIDAGQVTFSMITGYGFELPRQCEVKDDDYWYAAQGFGQCGNYGGQNFGQDASSRLNELINAKHCSLLSCANGGTVFYTSIDSITIIEGTGGNAWAFWSGDSQECFTPADIAYWWGVAEDVIEENRPQGKVFVNVDYTWDYWFGDEIFLHKAVPVRYGILNCSGGTEN